jgi:hypothetical protein
VIANARHRIDVVNAHTYTLPLVREVNAPPADTAGDRKW